MAQANIYWDLENYPQVEKVGINLVNSNVGKMCVRCDERLAICDQCVASHH